MLLARSLLGVPRLGLPGLIRISLRLKGECSERAFANLLALSIQFCIVINRTDRLAKVWQGGISEPGDVFLLQ